MNAQQIKNEKKAYDEINKKMDLVSQKLDTAIESHDMPAVEVHEKSWDLLQGKLQNLVDCSSSSFGITSDDYFKALGY